MSKRGRKHMELVRCEHGEHDGEFYEHCCLRKERDAIPQTSVWHRCELYGLEACPFGVLGLDAEGNVIRL